MLERTSKNGVTMTNAAGCVSHIGIGTEWDRNTLKLRMEDQKRDLPFPISTFKCSDGGIF